MGGHGPRPCCLWPAHGSPLQAMSSHNAAVFSGLVPRSLGSSWGKLLSEMDKRAHTNKVSHTETHPTSTRLSLSSALQGRMGSCASSKHRSLHAGGGKDFSVTRCQRRHSEREQEIHTTVP